MKTIGSLWIVCSLIVLLFSGCEEEPEERKLIISSHSLVFNDNETKKLYLSAKSECEYRILSYPDWIFLYPSSGKIANNIAEISLSSYFGYKPEGIYEGVIVIMSNFGIDTVNVKGFVGSNYNTPRNLDHWLS